MGQRRSTATYSTSCKPQLTQLAHPVQNLVQNLGPPSTRPRLPPRRMARMAAPPRGSSTLWLPRPTALPSQAPPIPDPPAHPDPHPPPVRASKNPRHPPRPITHLFELVVRHLECLQAQGLPRGLLRYEHQPVHLCVPRVAADVALCAEGRWARVWRCAARNARPARTRAGGAWVWSQASQHTRLSGETTAEAGGEGGTVQRAVGPAEAPELIWTRTRVSELAAARAPPPGRSRHPARPPPSPPCSPPRPRRPGRPVPVPRALGGDRGSVRGRGGSTCAP